MADVALVCVREDAWKGDLLGVALERYGFTVCRSASVFEDFSGYTAVVVLISPGAGRSELVMGTATRALDWGKLIPVFISMCPLPDRLSGVALHDLSSWDGEAEDNVVKAVAYHVHKLSGGAGGRPVLGEDRSLRRFAREAPPLQLTFEPNDFGVPQGGAYHQTYIAPPAHDLYEYDRSYGQAHADYQGGYGAVSYQPAGYGGDARRDPYFVAASQNEVDHYGVYAQPAYDVPAPLDVQIAVAPNEAARRRSSYNESRAEFVDPHRPFDRNHDVDWRDREEEPRSNRFRRFPGLFTVLIGATMLMSLAWFEEANTHQVVVYKPTPAAASALLSEPAFIEPETATVADASAR